MMMANGSADLMLSDFYQDVLLETKVFKIQLIIGIDFGHDFFLEEVWD